MHRSKSAAGPSSNLVEPSAHRCLCMQRSRRCRRSPHTVTPEFDQTASKPASPSPPCRRSLTDRTPRPSTGTFLPRRLATWRRRGRRSESRPMDLAVRAQSGTRDDSTPERRTGTPLPPLDRERACRSLLDGKLLKDSSDHPACGGPAYLSITLAGRLARTARALARGLTSTHRPSPSSPRMHFHQPPPEASLAASPRLALDLRPDLGRQRMRASRAGESPEWIPRPPRCASMYRPTNTFWSLSASA